MRSHDLLKGAAVAALLIAPVPALAANASGEIVTAATHADLADSAGDLAGAQMHLHHALNCLVGPGGKGYDAKSMNPCAHSGSGAIPDTADPAKKAKLENVADTIRAALAANDFTKAHAAALNAASTLAAMK